MAEKIDWVEMGREAYEQYFPIHRTPEMRRPSPTPEEREEERRKGMELFEELFADYRYPPEVLEEEPEEEPTPPREEVAFVEEPSPEQEPPPVKQPWSSWGTRRLDPPKWLTHSMDRDLFPEQRHPDWFTRFHDQTYPMSPIKSPYPPSPGISPGFWDISEALGLESPHDESFFLTPPPPAPPKELEPPLPKFTHDRSVPVTSFDVAMHKMHWELQKYEHDKEHIVNFVKMAPLVRDYEILTKELEALVKLYIPGVDAEKMEPLNAYYALVEYIDMTRKQLQERYDYEFFYDYKYPGISEEVLAAEVRLHKKKALEAIETYKRGYIFMVNEIEKAEAELANVKEEIATRDDINQKIHEELARLQKEEREEEEKYQSTQMIRHLQNCPFKDQALAMFYRQNELRRKIPEMKKELERTKEAYDRDVQNMHVWITLFPPNFVDRFTTLLTGRLTPQGFIPPPVERYMEFIDEIETDMQQKRSERKYDFQSLSSDCNRLTDLLNKYMAELEEAQRITNELLERKNSLGAELNTLKIEGRKWKALWDKLREENIYYREYNEMLLGKIIALHADASFKSEDLLAIVGPESRSPSPARPESRSPSPARPEFRSASPARPESRIPSPARPESRSPSPARPESGIPSPARPESRSPTPAGPDSRIPSPARPESRSPTPAGPDSRSRPPSGRPWTALSDRSGSDGSPDGPESRSPSQARKVPAETSPALPPAFGSETFNISQIESPREFDDSLGQSVEERPPSGRLWAPFSDRSGIGGSPTCSESISPSQAGSAPAETSPALPPAFGTETFNLSQKESPSEFDDSLDLPVEERPPSGRLWPAFSDRSGSGGSPALESIHQSQDQRESSQRFHDSLDQTGSSPRYDDSLQQAGPSPRFDDSLHQTGSPRYDDSLHQTGPSPRFDDSLDQAGSPRFDDSLDQAGSPRFDDSLDQTGSSPRFDDSLHQKGSSPRFDDSLDLPVQEQPPSGVLWTGFSDRSGSGGSPAHESIHPSPDQSDNLEDSLERASAIKKTVSIRSPGKKEQLRMDVEIVPQEIRRSPSGQRVVCDVAVELQEATLRTPRGIERSYQGVRGTPPISPTVGRRVQRRYGVSTPPSIIRPGHVSLRRPLFTGDFDSPDSPGGTAKRTHPESMNLPQRTPSPRPPRLDTTMEWENPEMNM